MEGGVNPRRTLYMRIRGDREIPLTRVGDPTTLEQIEGQAAELAKFYTSLWRCLPDQDFPITFSEHLWLGRTQRLPIAIPTLTRVEASR
jgi:hypothetical protein